MSRVIPSKKGPNFILGSVYRPPGQDLITFNDEFNLILSDLCKKYKIIHLAGDFNIDLLKYQSHNLTNQFVNCIAAHHLLPTITRPTRITATPSTLIDNIFTSPPANVLDSLIVVTDVSHHLPILINLDLAPSWLHGTNSSLLRNNNDSSMKIFKSLIEQNDWSSTSQLCDLDNTETAYNSFVNHIKSAYNNAFPLLPPRPRHKRLSYKPPWMTQGLLKFCKTKSKLYLEFLKNPTEVNKQKYIVYRNKFKALRIQS